MTWTPLASHISAPSTVARTSPSTTALTQTTRAGRRNGAWRLTNVLNRTRIYFVVATPGPTASATWLG